MKYTGRYPYTAGELIQGMIDDVHLHVSAPIDRFSSATFIPGRQPLEGQKGCEKSLSAVRSLMNMHGLPATGRLLVRSPFPRGKGFASSTADIAASLHAVSQAFNLDLTPHQLGRIAVGIEPTDGSIFQGIVLFDHRNGSILQPLGEPPPAKLLVVDTGGAVDTVQYNQTLNENLLKGNQDATVAALQLLREGLAKGDLAKLGEASRISAQRHQTVLPKPGLDEIDAIGVAHGAVGIAVAHSGTICSLIFPPDLRTAGAAEAIREQLGYPSFECWLSSGGPAVERSAWGQEIELLRSIEAIGS